MDRRVWFWGGLALSIGVTAVLWALGIPGFFFALAFPFFFFGAGKRDVPRCAACQAEVHPGDRFCARCGAAL